jgi:hypothetical protein
MGDPLDEMIKELGSPKPAELTEQDSKEVEKTKKDLELDIEDLNSIAENLVKMTKIDREQADQVFALFFARLGLNEDRSEASKEALTKALELKILASQNIIELLKIRSKATEIKNTLSFYNQGMSGKKAGVSLKSIKQERRR